MAILVRSQRRQPDTGTWLLPPRLVGRPIAPRPRRLRVGLGPSPPSPSSVCANSSYLDSSHGWMPTAMHSCYRQYAVWVHTSMGHSCIVPALVELSLWQPTSAAEPTTAGHAYKYYHIYLLVSPGCPIIRVSHYIRYILPRSVRARIYYWHIYTSTTHNLSKLLPSTERPAKKQSTKSNKCPLKYHPRKEQNEP